MAEAGGDGSISTNQASLLNPGQKDPSGAEVIEADEPLNDSDPAWSDPNHQVHAAAK